MININDENMLVLILFVHKFIYEPFECASFTSCGAFVRPESVSNTRCFWKSSSFIIRKNCPKISHAEISVTHSLFLDKSEITSSASVLIV